LSDSDGYQYRKVNFQVDSMMMLVVDYDDKLFQEYCHLFEQVHQEVLLNQPEEKIMKEKMNNQLTSGSVDEIRFVCRSIGEFSS